MLPCSSEEHRWLTSFVSSATQIRLQRTEHSFDSKNNKPCLLQFRSSNNEALCNFLPPVFSSNVELTLVYTKGQTKYANIYKFKKAKYTSLSLSRLLSGSALQTLLLLLFTRDLRLVLLHEPGIRIGSGRKRHWTNLQIFESLWLCWQNVKMVCAEICSSAFSNMTLYRIFIAKAI